MSRLKVVFFGSPEFAVPSLEAVASHHDVALVVTQPDRPAGRGLALKPPPVKELAARLGIEVTQPVAPLKREEELRARLEALAPDVFVVVAYGRILPQAWLDVPRLGPYNVHASLLPKYRGAAPIQWSIIRGETETGVCVMRMEAGLDTGPVLARRAIPIAPDDTAGTLAPRLAGVGAALLVEALPKIAAGTLGSVPQDDAAATLAPILKKEDGHLDFTQPASAVAARARGVDPWPSAYALVDGDAVKLFRPTVLAPGGTPGEVIGAREGHPFVVACGEGSVAFAEIQLPGRKRLPAAAVLAGRALLPGTRLG